MLNQLQEFAKATDQAMCKIFNDYGNELTALSTIALIAPPTRVVGAGIALAQTAARHGCNWDPAATGPGGPQLVLGCKEWTGCQVSIYYKTRDKDEWQYRTDVRSNEYIKIETTYTGDQPGAVYDWKFELYFTKEELCTDHPDPGPWIVTINTNDEFTQFDLRPGSGECLKPNEPNTPPTPEPYTYTGDESGCSLVVNFEGWGQLPDGSMEPIMRIEPSAETKASGGVIGGCNFEPTIYYGGDGSGGGGGGGYNVPYLPEPNPDGDPQWQDLLNAALAGAAGAAINQALDAALSKVYDGAIYRMDAPCDKDEYGNPLVWEKQIPPATSTDALGYRLTALHEQISQALAWKTPICHAPCREGDFRTINFRSASPSPYSASRLRKRFRYRSTSGLGLGQVVDHWKDFSFRSGPVVVGHVGSAWGHPQVWAASADEGKRVIRHAAGEAGIDPDQVGEWRIGSSNSSRNGVSDTMRVDTEGGFYRITSRDGSDGRPIVAKDIDL